MFRKTKPKGAPVTPATISIDGIDMIVEEGEPVAAALLRTAPFITRTTPIGGAPRAPYCMMGVCFECLVEIDGITSTRSCLQGARHGMVVRRQIGRLSAAAADEA